MTARSTKEGGWKTVEASINNSAIPSHPDQLIASIFCSWKPIHSVGSSSYHRWTLTSNLISVFLSTEQTHPTSSRKEKIAFDEFRWFFVSKKVLSKSNLMAFGFFWLGWHWHEDELRLVSWERGFESRPFILLQLNKSSQKLTCDGMWTHDPGLWYLRPSIVVFFDSP